MEPTSSIASRRTAGYNAAMLRRLQFDLKALLGLVTVLALMLGVWCYRARMQADVIADIHAKGGGIMYKHWWKSEERNWSYSPEWLRQFVDGDRVTTLYLDRRSFGDEDLQRLVVFPNLQRVVLSRTSATEDGIATLKYLLPACEIIQFPD